MVETSTSWIKRSLIKRLLIKEKYGPTRNSNPHSCWCHKEGAEGAPPGIKGHPRLAIFHELASVNNFAGVLNASLSFVLLTWISQTFLISSSERLFHLADTYESLWTMSGISLKIWFSDKARVKTFCEFLYARKLVKSRELQFLGERGWEGEGRGGEGWGGEGRGGKMSNICNFSSSS